MFCGALGLGVLAIIVRGYYQTSEEWALDAIKNRRLKLARLEEMNDPFELLAVSLRSRGDRADFLRIKRELHNELQDCLINKLQITLPNGTLRYWMTCPSLT